MVVVTSKRLLVKLVILHVALFGLITGLANFSIIEEEIDLKNRIYTVEIDFIMPINKETFKESLKLTSEFPKQKPKHTVAWLDSSTVRIKVWDINYPKGQEFKLKINKANTLIPLIKKTETLEFRIPTEPEVIGFNSKKYLSTLEPIRISFNVPMSPENIEKGIKLTDLQTGKLITGELEPVAETINGSKYQDYSRWDFRPEVRLDHNKRYEILVNSGIKSGAGIELNSTYKKNFTTASRPKILTTEPRDKEEKASLYPEIQITANEIMKRASVEVKRKEVKSNELIDGRVSVVDNKISFTPEAALLPDTTYEITVVGYSLYDEPTEKLVFSFTTIDKGENYWVDVKLGDIHTVKVYKGKLVIRHMVASGGKEESQTPLGTYYTGDKGYSFWSPRFGEGAVYWVRLFGQVLFHSVPRGATGDLKEEEHLKLGLPASHGCIRLDDKDARWIFDNLPVGTPVIVHR